MAEPRPHEPKLRALAAYASGALRGEARARLERHLAACAVCRSALAGQRRYAVLLEETRAAAPPELAWAGMQRVMESEAARARRRARRRWVVPAALAAAACLALVVAQQLRRPAARPVARMEQAKARVATPVEPAPLAIRVSALVGRVEAVDAAGRRSTVGLDSRLQEGWTLETGKASELHLALGAAATVLLDDDSRLGLERVRESDVVLSLERGRVINAVRPLAGGARYHVAALGHEIAVRGTHFAVEQQANGLGVQVDEGWVSVMRDGVLVAELRAPQRWRQVAASGDAPASRVAPLARPREPGAGFEEWPALQVPAWPRAVRWEIDGAQLGGGAELAMRVPRGDVDVVALLAGGLRMRGRVHVDALGARFDPRGLQLVGPAPEEPAADAGGDPAEAAAVIRAGQPELQRCYERSMRSGPNVPRTARLHLEIDARGRVRSAELTASEELPAVLTDCIRAVAGRWQFTAPGGAGIAFEAPVRFHLKN